MSRNAFLIAAAAIVLAAFGLREWFVLTMTVPEPNLGDVGDYLRYALHMAWDGTFSMSQDKPVPDAYRSPGYPTLLYLLFPGNWIDGSWYARIYQAQAVLGAATVAGVIALARSWLSKGFSLLAGALMAVQAHNVAASGTLLTEVLFGTLLIGALLALVHAADRQSWRLGLLAGALMGMGLLTNPVLSLLPIVMVPVLWRRARVPALVMAATAMLALGGWSIRNAMVHADGSARAGLNFVQGSWPEFHDVLKRPGRWPEKEEAIQAEVAALQTGAATGVQQVLRRMATEPMRYARWYAYKPYLLFDWEVRVGQGMIYVVTMRDTVLDRGIGLGLTVIQWRWNPLLFWLAAMGLGIALLRDGPARLVAVATLYLTAVHVVLQAEPRYAIPYRSLEISLAVTALASLWDRLRSRRMARPIGSEAGGPANENGDHVAEVAGS